MCTNMCLRHLVHYQQKSISTLHDALQAASSRQTKRNNVANKLGENCSSESVTLSNCAMCQEKQMNELPITFTKCANVHAHASSGTYAFAQHEPLSLAFGEPMRVRPVWPGVSTTLHQLCRTKMSARSMPCRSK